MKFPHKRLLLAAALGLPVTFAGCQSRAELLTSTSADSPNRTVVSEPDPGPADEPAQEQAESQRTGETEAAQSASSTGSASLENPDPSTPRAILESAGAVIEFDDSERAIGIDLTQTRLSPEVSRSVAELGHLQWLDLRGTRVTDADLAVICALPQFELIALGQTEITDGGLQHLRQQKNLRFLSLDGTNVTDAGLAALNSLPRLEGISAADTAITRAAARAFEARNPACHIILDEDASEVSAPQSASPQTPEPALPQDATSARPQRAADLPDARIDWAEPDAAALPDTKTLEPTREQLEPIDWPEPSPESQQQPADRRSTARPAPGEPTAETDTESPWYLDKTQASVFPQPLPQPSVPRSTAVQESLDAPQESVTAEPDSVRPLPGPSAEHIPQIQRQTEITPRQTPALQAVPVQASAGSAEETAQQLNQVLQQRLLDAEVLTVLSRHLMARQEYAKAARALEALAALQPDDPQVRFDLGVALARNGHYEQAHPQLASVVGDATAWYNLGVIAFERDEPQHSERFFGRALDLAPDFHEARTWLTRVRNTTATSVSPAVQTPDPVDSRDLVDLLMSEFGTGNAAGNSPAANRSAAGITIVPAK